MQRVYGPPILVRLSGKVLVLHRHRDPLVEPFLPEQRQYIVEGAPEAPDLLPGPQKGYPRLEIAPVGQNEARGAHDGSREVELEAFRRATTDVTHDDVDQGD